MLKLYDSFDWDFKLEARIYEFRKRMRSKRAIEADWIKEAAKFEQELDQAYSDGRDEDAGAAHDKWVAIKMQLDDFPGAGKP